jgi:putative Holliday junction resolvase
VVGLDLGRRRIGVAVSDSEGRMAVPHVVIARSGDAEADRRAVVEAVAELGAGRVVVGLPLSLEGGVGPAARDAQAEAEALAEALDVPVELHDERLTTVVADRAMQAAGIGGRSRRRVIDSSAAAVILQSWLDRRKR